MKKLCKLCNRDHERVNSAYSECSVPDCPHRRKAWSDREKPVFKGPWPVKEDKDPDPIDAKFKIPDVRRSFRD